MLKEATFEEDYNDIVMQIETNSNYRRLPAREKTYMTATEMAKLLGISRNSVYGILKYPVYKEFFEFITVADRKRITKESYERFLNGQEKYKLDEINDYEELSMENNIALAEYRRMKLKGKQPRTANGNLEYLTYEEAAIVAKVSRTTIYEWVRKESFPVIHIMKATRIPRSELYQVHYQ